MVPAQHIGKSLWFRSLRTISYASNHARWQRYLHSVDSLSLLLVQESAVMSPHCPRGVQTRVDKAGLRMTTGVGCVTESAIYHYTAARPRLARLLRTSRLGFPSGHRLGITPRTPLPRVGRGRRGRRPRAGPPAPRSGCVRAGLSPHRRGFGGRPCEAPADGQSPWPGPTASKRCRYLDLSPRHWRHQTPSREDCCPWQIDLTPHRREPAASLRYPCPS